ncbi:hypothetical protein HGRIS_002746 [Hohenbuehelia grisea]|uniref:F-box domain-containing protein n=1 Tax=Hohenbuehelia grisea TaxID=104357 RepID=A0ABR3JLF0_9AGAR
MTYPSLPVEIFLAILSHISDRPTLLSLLRTCGDFREEVERVLYRVLFTNTLEVGKRTLLLTRLRETPRLAQYVRCFALSVPDATDPPDPVLTVPIHLMTNLDDLRVLIGPNLSTADMQRNCHDQLKHLTWAVGNDHIPTAFLERQRRLVSLKLIFDDETAPLPQPTALPNLRFLTARHIKTIRELMFGRNIIGSKWTLARRGTLRTSDITPPWQFALGNLCVLDISALHIPDISTVIPHLTKLVIIIIAMEAVSGLSV